MMSESQKGLIAAVLAPFFLGMAPIFGKLALQGGADPFTVAAFRTSLVALMLWALYLVIWRQYVFIYPAGLLACMAIGATNGIGSLFYYSGLNLLDASVAQLLNATYVIFVVLLTRIEGTHITAYTLLRVGVALLGVLFITGGLSGDATWLGIGLMLGNALLFAGTVVMSQRILYEMPAQTVTLYVMTAMAGVVILARVVSDFQLPSLSGEAWSWIIALGISTMLSRLLLFAGVKGVGSLRTTLLAVGESAVAVSLAFLFLEERLTGVQWMGVAALVGSLFMPTEKRTQEAGEGPHGSLPNVAGVRFQRMVSTDKLSTKELDSVINRLLGDTDALDEQEMERLRRLLGDDGLQKLRDIEQRHTKR